MLCVLSLFLWAVYSYGEEPNPRKAAKEALAKYQDALVAVKFVLKIGNQELRQEVEGTVISPGGLTVVSNFRSNPDSGLGDADHKTETTDVKIILKDGREIPARFVLRDRDLDIAFILPKEKDAKLTHVPIGNAPVPEVLDDLIFLHRLGPGLNREPSVALGRVEAVVKKPQTFVVPDFFNGLQNIGCPTFDASGRFVGVVVVRRSGSTGRTLQGLQPVILPAEDLEQTAGQIEKP
jgi:hypothetical protein